MGAIGYDSFLMPASPGQGSRNSSQGGVGILVKAHLGARFRAQFSREGCGYVAVTIRTQGADLTLVSLYLQCSTGYAGPVNAAILSSLRDLRHGIRGPLLVGGDWNVSLPELLETSIMESLLLRPMGTNLPTCGTTSWTMLDFLLVSRALPQSPPPGMFHSSLMPLYESSSK